MRVAHTFGKCHDTNSNGIFVFFVAILFVAPSVVSADSYSGPYCFENPADYVGVTSDSDAYDAEGIRGTCKKVEAETVVSLDPALQKDYFLGTHSPIAYDCEIMGCWSTKYSEALFLTSRSTLAAETVGVVNRPFEYALFEKAYFVPLLSKMLKEVGISFSESTMPTLGIYILKKSELDEIQRTGSYMIPKDVKMDSFYTDSTYPSGRYTMYSLNYQEYGKHIYAPKGILIESQYADLEKAINMLTNNDLQIEIVPSGKRSQTAVVPITSPLKSIANYWIYTKKAGKITLSWQKSEYELDNGQVKVITEKDKNITAAMLFSDAVPATYQKKIESSQATTSDISQTEKKKGFFSRLLDVILSWFR